MLRNHQFCMAHWLSDLVGFDCGILRSLCRCSALYLFWVYSFTRLLACWLAGWLACWRACLPAFLPCSFESAPPRSSSKVGHVTFKARMPTFSIFFIPAGVPCGKITCNDLIMDDVARCAIGIFWPGPFEDD